MEIEPSFYRKGVLVDDEHAVSLRIEQEGSGRCARLKWRIAVVGRERGGRWSLSMAGGGEFAERALAGGGQGLPPRQATSGGRCHDDYGRAGLVLATEETAAVVMAMGTRPAGCSVGVGRGRGFGSACSRSEADGLCSALEDKGDTYPSHAR